MKRYAHIEAGTIVWERDYPEALDPAVMAAKNIVEIVVTDPPFDPAIQVRSEAVDTIQTDRVDRVFTVTDKTAGEMDAEADARAKADVDNTKALRAVVVWAAGKLGVPPADARNEIIAIYKGLQ